MPITKLNMRQERFCLGVAEGLPQSRAYIAAGYAARGNAAEVEASKMVRLPKVAARVAELQAKAARRSEITVDSLVAELEDMLQLATRVGQPSAGVSAIMGKAKLLGLVIDRTEVESTLRKPSRTPTTDKSISMDDWVRRFAPKRVN
ncbi:terminase small subunit [Mesorhizobium sp. LjNodule214]|uniref:terminase small subunit n=1 Tax=Mesorhizobium sp. LjNodule214 TaxID=3342252 RepID=UPI003ECD1E90